MNIKRFSFSLIAAVFVAMLSTTTFAQDQKISSRNDITGTWLVNVQLDAATANINVDVIKKFPKPAQMLSGESTQAPFTIVETFHSDGTFSENSLLDYLPPQSTPGLGVWERTGMREFASTLYAVIIGSSSNPEFQGTLRVRSKLTLNQRGDQFSGTGRAEIFDPDGNLVFSFDGPVEGRRAAVIPLP